MQRTKRTPTSASLATSVFDITSANGTKAGIDQFEKHKDSGIYYLRESEMNNVVFALCETGRVKEGKAILELNQKAFPETGASMATTILMKILENDLDAALTFYHQQKTYGCLLSLGTRIK